MYEGGDSETESNIPIFYIHTLKKCLSLIPGYAEDFMDTISEEMRLCPNLVNPVFESNFINVEKKVARHKLIQSEPVIYRIVLFINLILTVFGHIISAF